MLLLLLLLLLLQLNVALRSVAASLFLKCTAHMKGTKEPGLIQHSIFVAKSASAAQFREGESKWVLIEVLIHLRDFVSQKLLKTTLECSHFISTK